jgi:hypothetical protein
MDPTSSLFNRFLKKKPLGSPDDGAGATTPQQPPTRPRPVDVRAQPVPSPVVCITGTAPVEEKAPDSRSARVYSSSTSVMRRLMRS